MKGLVWRRDGQLVTNADRPFIANLDHLPLPLHHLLPMQRYRIPMPRGPYAFVVTSRGCPAGCRYCIKHVNYQQTVRLRSPESILEELHLLDKLGIGNVHMYADPFTVSREQVVRLCELMLQEGLRMRWTCNSRVDYVDQEMLQLMARAGCWFISWGIESASETVLRRAHKGYRTEQVGKALRWAKAAGIKNWGYFMIGLPGETEETIKQTIDLAKRLPLDLALFHIAAPHPGTPFYLEVMGNGWFRPGVPWEDVDMDRSTVLDYPHLSAEQLEARAPGLQGMGIAAGAHLDLSEEHQQSGCAQIGDWHRHTATRLDHRAALSIAAVAVDLASDTGAMAHVVTITTYGERKDVSSWSVM